MSMPATSLIDSIFDGVSQAFADVSNAVDTHSNRLADNPCAWRNELSAKVEGLTNRLGNAFGVAQMISQAGRDAIASAQSVAGFAAPGRKFNSSELQSFGAWLRNAGYPIGPPLPISLVTYPFVRRGEPRKNFAVPLPQAGAGLDSSGKLAGPAIFAEWEDWLTYMRASVEPRGPIRRRNTAEGWRQILALLVGSSDWRQGDRVSPQSQLGQSVRLQEIALEALAQAQAACVPDAAPPPTTSETTTPGGAAIRAAGLAALYYFL